MDIGTSYSVHINKKSRNTFQRNIQWVYQKKSSPPKVEEKKAQVEGKRWMREGMKVRQLSRKIKRAKIGDSNVGQKLRERKHELRDGKKARVEDRKVHQKLRKRKHELRKENTS